MTMSTMTGWFRHVLRLLVAAMLAWVGTADAAPFLKPQEAAALQGATSLQLESLGAMVMTPRFVPDSERQPQPLSADEARRLHQALREVEGVPRPADNTCQFAPGFQLTFLDTRQQVVGRILVCLNCRVYAMAETLGVGPVARFGRLALADPVWAVLKAHYPHLFPN